MNYQQFRTSIERPYWSPVHPSRYIMVEPFGNGRLRHSGWGLLYPDSVGSFNLLWLISGASMPLTTYKPWLEEAKWVANNVAAPIGRYLLNEAAAVLPLSDFKALLERENDGTFNILLAAAH